MGEALLDSCAAKVITLSGDWIGMNYTAAGSVCVCERVYDDLL